MINSILFVILMAPASGAEQNPIAQFLPIVLIIFVFYFFMIRPQIKKNKDQKKYMASIKVGDKVITIGGMHGKITDIDEQTFTIEISPNVRVKVEKNAITMDPSTLSEQKK